VSAATISRARIGERARLLEEPAARETTDVVEALRVRGQSFLGLYGSPHWLPPTHVLEAARAAVEDRVGAPAQGLPALREAAAHKLAHSNGIVVPPEQILVTNAANHGLSIVLTSLLDPGDEVLTFSPHYYYQGLIELAGGVPRYAITRFEDGWAWDLDALEGAVTSRTKVVVVNTPTNPTGYVATREDLAAIAELAQRHDLVIVSDEAYDHTVYDGKTHLSIGALQPAADRTITICSCTKSYVMRHWRVGFVAAPERFVSTFRKVLEWNCFHVNHVAQHAAAAAIDGPQDFVRVIAERFERCRDLMLTGLAGAVGISFVRPGGGPFLFVNADPLRGGAAALRRLLLYEYGVATDLGGPFGSERHLRLPFGGEFADVAEAAKRISVATRALSDAE
jgi:aspartate/methionine/tyrosine aminotransferase